MPSRMLDPNYRDPEQAPYVCSMHFMNRMRQVDEYGRLEYDWVALDEHIKCSNCVAWDDLCDEWYDVSRASVRCLRPKGHDAAHLVDTPDGQRLSWLYEEPEEATSYNTMWLDELEGFDHGAAVDQNVVFDFNWLDRVIRNGKTKDVYEQAIANTARSPPKAGLKQQLRPPTRR